MMAGPLVRAKGSNLGPSQDFRGQKQTNTGGAPGHPELRPDAKGYTPKTTQRFPNPDLVNPLYDPADKEPGAQLAQVHQGTYADRNGPMSEVIQSNDVRLHTDASQRQFPSGIDPSKYLDIDW
jgi:hypothetical protein